MIPTPAVLQAALAPYLLYIKAAAWLLVVAAIFGAGCKVGAGFTERRWQAAQAAQAREYQSAVERARAAERASWAKRDEVSTNVQAELEAVRAERDRLRRLPARVVRVQVPAADPGRVPGASPAAPGSDGAAAGAAAPAGPAFVDIGRGLYDLADDGDAREAELAARLTACQQWAATR